MSLQTPGAPAAESPTAENETVNEGAEAPEGSTAAESSTADEGAKPANLLDVVKDAIKPVETAAAASPTAEGEGEAQVAEAEPKAATPEEQAEADKALPFHEHPRWKEVIAERDGYKEDASSFREITTFMRTHGLTGDEVAEGYDIMAKLKSGEPKNLAEVREYFSTRLAFLDDVLGNVLPEDLRQRVDSGAIDEEAAQELARARASEKLLTAQAETRATRDTEAETQRATVANAQACATAVDDWEKRVRSADPDYAKKAALVETTCRAIVQEKGAAPRNPQEAVALAKEALDRVNAQLAAALPKPKAVVKAPSGSSARVVDQPKTLLDAVRGSLSDSR